MVSHPVIQVDRIEAVAQTTLERYGASLREFDGPVPPGVLAVIIAHESGGRPWARTSETATMTGAETGLVQAVPEEVERFDFDPFDPRAAIWGAQASYARHAKILAERIKAAHRIAWPEIPERERIMLLLLCRSIGIGAVRTLVQNSGARRESTVWRRMTAWLATRAPYAHGAAWGKQSTEVIRFRVRVIVALYDLGRRMVATSGYTDKAHARPRNLKHAPSNYLARIAELARRAKTRGYRPTGAWGA